MSRRDHSVTVVLDVGTPSPGFTPPPDYRSWATTEVRYHGFADLSVERNREVVSPEFMCLGYRWTVKFFPGGEENSAEGMVAAFLWNMSNRGTRAQFAFRVKDSSGDVVSSSILHSFDFGPRTGDGSSSTSNAGADLDMRSNIIEHLVGGTLVLEVSMKLADPAATTLAPFIPENPFCSNMLSSFMDEESADIVFEVCQERGDQKTRARKKAKKSASMFYAHQLILLKCAPQLAELCGSGDKHLTSIQIPDVSPSIFRHLLYYVYGGKLPGEVMEENARDILLAADRYGVTNLKLEAEACLVQSTTFSVDNVLENLLFADSKNCALLKEAAMDFIVENSVEAMKQISFEDAPPTMITDVLAAVSRGKKKSGEDTDDDYNTMRISELRREAHEKGLDVDRSREALIAALEQNS